ncbi:MAG: hypothetical protein A2X49_01220 [Lentisphaerae bacterium GWF2_52_8]|nr:MAG: hypothetical protein A2X49_01220 [Lentisphaerae bacterium GWF2_52_8]
MSLTALESNLFESIEFCLALLGTIPVPIVLVKPDNSAWRLNTAKLDGNYQILRCSHDKNNSETWFLDPSAKNCPLCQAVAHARLSGTKELRKGVWKTIIDGAPREFIIAVHAVPTLIKDENFVLVAIEDLTEVEQLKGLLPICMECNKIYSKGNDKWVRIDQYISEHSPAKFSHGICPECANSILKELK